MALPDLPTALARSAGSPATATAIAREAAAAVAPDGGRLKTFIAVDTEVAPAAERSSDALLGLVFGLKDNIDVAGFTTTCGSRALDQEPPATADSWIAAALKKAGGQCIGKNNMHEFALGGTGDNARFGNTANPWDTGRNCGGSSGGSASAVAQRQIHLSLGTDSGGSVRQPASFTGIVGFKPTANRLPMEGVAGAAWTIDCLGTFTRTVADLRTIWAAIMEPDAAAPARPRYGYLADESMGRVEPVVWEKYLADVRRLEAAGAELVPVSLPGFNDCPSICITIAYAEIASLHYELMRTRPHLYDQDIRGLIALGDIWSGRHYLDAERQRTLHRARFSGMLAPFDAILTPSVPIQPPRIGEKAHVTGDPPGAYLYALMRFTVLHNITGYPGISVPTGLDPDGLPAGIQLIGRPGRDAELLALAAAAETVFGPMPAPPATRL